MEEGGTWRQASQEQLAGRQIVKVRRKGVSAPAGAAAAAAPMNAFNFGLAAKPSAAAPAAAPAAVSTEAAPMNALQRLAAAQAASGWACPSCETRNKNGTNVCAACETPNPSAPAAAAAAVPAAAAAGGNALERLAAKLASESWECPTCSTQNKLSAGTCGACEEPRPGSTASNGTAAPAAAAAGGFSFGAQPSGDVAAAAPASVGFSFGSSTGSVSFGAPTSGDKPAGAAAPFSFGAGEASASAATFGSVPSFSFGGGSLGLAGAPLATFGSVASGTASGAAAGGFGEEGGSEPKFEESSAEALANEKTELASEFKNASKESTGEENDTVHLRQATKVFQMKRVPKVSPQAATGPAGEVAAAAGADGAAQPAAAAASDATSQETQLKFVEIGAGELHVNTVVDPVTGKTRGRLVSARHVRGDCGTAA
jgi:hypothetical protein